MVGALHGRRWAALLLGLPAFGVQACALAAPSSEPASEPGTGLRPLGEGETGVVVRCGKLLTLDDADRVFDPGMLVARNGKIEYVGPEIAAPAGFQVLEYPEAWASPGMIDLHSHIQTGSWEDINDMVEPINPQLRVRPTVRPSDPSMRRACAGGCTTLFGIPGSGTSISGFGVLYKTKTDAGYEDIVLRDPGGMKSAYNYNPQRGGGDLGSSWAGLFYTVERLNRRAVAALEQGTADPALEDLKKVHAGELPVLIHCASAEGVAGVVRMWKQLFDTKCVVSHGDWDGHLAARFLAESGVPLNHGPRTHNFTTIRREDRILGTAAAFVEAGVPNFSLNTDANVMPQEELFLQGSMSARLGAEPYAMLRAVTTHPAKSFLIDDRVGSLETGKDADVVISSGDPLDPRSRVELVLIDGQVQYSRQDDGQWF